MNEPIRRSPRRPRLVRGAEDEDRTGRPLRAAIDAYLTSQGLADVSLLARVLEMWTDVVGKDVAQHVRPTGFSGDELQVDVDQPGWATEVAFLSETITSRLVERLGVPISRQVKVHVRGKFGVE